MELRHLRYFLAVAETSSFTRAAEMCVVAQSALSEQVARLETEIGAKLFHRTSRRVALTLVGEALRPLAERVVSDVEHAQVEMAALTGLRAGRLRMGIIQASGGPVDLVDLLTAYRQNYPDIELTVRSGASADMATAVAGGELDVAVVALTTKDLPPKLTRLPIADDPLVAVLSHDAAVGAPNPISLADLLDRGPFIQFLPGSGIRTGITAAFARAGLEVEAPFEVGTVSDLARLAAAGLGVTVIPASSAAHEAGGTLSGAASDASFVTVPLADRLAVHPVGVVYDPHRLSPAAAAFVDILPTHDDA